MTGQKLDGMAQNWRFGLKVGHSCENFLVERKFLTVNIDFERRWLYEMVLWVGQAKVTSILIAVERSKMPEIFASGWIDDRKKTVSSLVSKGIIAEHLLDHKRDAAGYIAGKRSRGQHRFII